MENENIQNETVQNEAAQDENVQNETVQDETVQDENAQNETAQDETVQNENVENENSSLPTKKQVEKERKRYRRQKAYNKALSGTIYVLTIVAAVAVLIATLVLPVLQIEGTSMEPTLVAGDIVLLTKNVNFERGELCGFSWNNKLLIKRVIGIPGDWIEMDTDGTVYLNGEKLEEPYAERLAMGECDLEFPFQVPQEQYFVLGDMRESSIDSRNTLIGCVEKDQIVGKVFFRVWPFDSITFF